MGSACARGATLMASGGEESKEEAEISLAAMAEDKCSAVETISAAVEMIFAVAGQVVGQKAVISIQDEFADNELFCFVAEEGKVGQPEFGSRSPVGLHVGEKQHPQKLMTWKNQRYVRYGIARCTLS